MKDRISENKSLIIYVSGLILLLCISAITHISVKFGLSIPLTGSPVLSFVILLMLSTVPYLIAVWVIRYSELKKNIIYFIFITGLLLRLISIFSVPVLEVDYFRYLWDGASVASRINPYQYSPSEIVKGNIDSEKIAGLAGESGEVLSNINHKELKTIYPPVTQLFFASSYLIKPWDLSTWKMILLLVDIINFMLLIYILKMLDLPKKNSLIYWWNPLVIYTTFNAVHYDVITIMFVLFSLLLALKERVTWTTIATALGVGSKLWPVLLFPLLVRPYLKKWYSLLKYAFMLTVIMAIIFLPVLKAGIDSSSGFVVYGKHWENNSPWFITVLFIFEQICKYIGVHPGFAQQYSRIFILILISAITIYLFLKNSEKKEIPRSMLVLVSSLFLLSPAQFPWYFTWIVPLLVFKPGWSLLIFTTLLPLYYTRFYLEPRGMIDIFRYRIIWIEFIPVWIMLFMEWKGCKLFSFYRK